MKAHLQVFANGIVDSKGLKRTVQCMRDKAVTLDKQTPTNISMSE